MTRKEICHRYYLRHKIKLLKKRKQYYRTHKQQTANTNRKYREKHKDKIKFLQATYQLKHKTEIKEKRRKKYKTYRHVRNKHLKQRRKIDIIFRLISSMRNRTSRTMTNIKHSKKTSELIGCSGGFLQVWLSLQFTEGMSWANYGNGENKWNLDHIRPCASFDLRIPEHQEACFHYTNLRPLWYLENIKKSNKITKGVS